MRVAESGLYHVVMDLDADGSVGEKYILVAPANFGVRGAMNGWGYTSYTASEFNKETITFTSPEDITIRKNQEFKFAYANPGATDGAWKIVLDTLRDAVKAEISLGEGLVTGADNIVFSENSAIYQVQLQWTLSLGENKNSFKVVYTKTGDVPYTDPATQVISLIGSAFNNNEGSPADWNFDVDLAYVATDANGVSTYSTVIDLIPGDFKVRLAHDWGTNWGYDSSKITGDTGNVSDNGGNIKVAAAKKYKVTFSYNWESFEWVGLDLTVQ